MPAVIEIKKDENSVSLFCFLEWFVKLQAAVEKQFCINKQTNPGSIQ